jgi:DivIVA domain-containing protein
VGAVSAVVAGVVSGGLADPGSPIPARALPPGPLTGDDVEQLRFVQAFRGYRMDQVDAAMDSLAAEVDRLRRLVPGEGEGPGPVAPADLGSEPAGTDEPADTSTWAGPGHLAAERETEVPVEAAGTASLPSDRSVGRD